MKASLLSLCLLGSVLSSGAVVAQTTLANGTFETWDTSKGPEGPAQWVTSDQVAARLFAPLPITVGGVTKSTEVNGGQFAARMSFKNVTVPLLGTVVPVPAVLLLGTEVPDVTLATLPRTEADIIRLRPGGIPFTARPVAMQFWYKYLGPATETGQVGLLLTNGDQIVGQTSTLLTGGVPDYTRISMPITYDPAFASLTPDVLRIYFVAGTGTTPSTTAQLFVDDVTLPLTVTANRNPELAAALTLYPNPSANGDFSLASLQKPGVATAPFVITDAAGRVVQRQAAAPLSEANGRLISLRGQPAGMYLLRLATPEGPLTRKLVLQ